jgi:outer membrane protein
MKKLFLLLISIIGLTNFSNAQKFGYIDSGFILSKMPAYANAQQEANRLSENWQREIEGMLKEIEKLEKNYRAEEVLLTAEMKAKRQKEIADKQEEVRSYQRKIFGFEGMLFKRRQDLIKPVQDEVFTAVEKVAKNKQIQIMFDKSGDLVMIYTNPVHDYTEFVLEELGLASPDQNTPGKRPPANAIIDRPENTPVIKDESGEFQEDAVPDQKEMKRTNERKPAAGSIDKAPAKNRK